MQVPRKSGSYRILLVAVALVLIAALSWKLVRTSIHNNNLGKQLKAQEFWDSVSYQERSS